jgi:hypothetical protein
VRGADDAHLDRNGPRAAHAHDLALFQHAQQACLQRQRHLADFVEEQRAAMAASKTRRVRHGARR